MDPTTRTLTMGASGSAAKTYVEDVFSTWLYTGNGRTQSIVNNIALGDGVTSLYGKTITNLGSSFATPLSNINDGVEEVSNATNIAYTTGTFDIYVDLVSPTVVTAYLLAPQGVRGSIVYNTPTAFTVYASNDASSWTTITSVSSVSTGYPAWNAGDFRTFSFSNSTAYRYWRLAITASSAPGNISVSEWQVTGTQSGAGKGGLVWMKARSIAYPNFFIDTARGIAKPLRSDAADGASTSAAGYDLTSFNSTGFSLGPDWVAPVNTSNDKFASWTFRKAEKFFDICTWTGSGANRTISHNLGSVPGCIIVKRTDTTGDWQVYNQNLANTEYLVLNSTAAKATGTTRWNSTTPTSTVFSLGTDATVNASGGTYVAYLFASDAGGFGDSGNESVVSCGTYVGNGSSSGPTVTLGWEPQWVMIKAFSTTGDWFMSDTMRGQGVSGSSSQTLYANRSDAEQFSNFIAISSTGFRLTAAVSDLNGLGQSYIYIAIRRGPMKTPTDATKVFKIDKSADSTRNFGIVVDTVLSHFPAGNSGNFPSISARLTGNGAKLTTFDTASESTNSNWYAWDKATGLWGETWGTSWINYAFRRAPGFFDAVCYTGTGTSAQVVSHNLTVVPELFILKRRSSGTGQDMGWPVAVKQGSDGIYFIPGASSGLNTNGSGFVQPGYWSLGFTSTTFTPGEATLSSPGGFTSGQTYIAYLFASCPGVSKVGSYTGTGTTLNIDCGFTAGARFVLIKRADSTGSWYVWDTARGIVSGNDPYLLLNSTAAEVTNTDYIDPLSSGFQISSTAPAEINANGGSFIYLAVA